MLLTTILTGVLLMAAPTPLLSFDPPGPAWTFNTGSQTGSESKISGQPCDWGTAARFEVYVKDRWEAFKTSIPKGAVPTGNRVLLFRAKTDGRVRALRVKLGEPDGTWWEANAMVADHWQIVVFTVDDFTLIHDPEYRRTGTPVRLDQATEIQFEGSVPLSDRYVFELAEVRTAEAVPEGLTDRAATASANLYHPPGMDTWDYWFLQRDGVYHAYYLQAMTGLGPAKHGNQHVGHAVSRDLVSWTNLGPALVPIHGTWNDLSIATGSTVEFEGKGWMVFTGRGSKISGIGLAESRDLVHWQKVGDGPVAPLGQAFDAEWDGQPVKWRALADPYLYPEPIDGWFYLVINSIIDGEPLYSRGCLTTMRSKDLKTWEPYNVLAHPGWFTRMETPQLWRHGDLWYLYFGGVREREMPEEFVKAGPDLPTMGNYYFVSKSLDEPFEPLSQYRLNVPDPRFAYICKVLRGPDGSDVMLTTIAGQFLSRPYSVRYHEDGTLRLGLPRD